jgi:hypothetical protein
MFVWYIYGLICGCCCDWFWWYSYSSWHVSFGISCGWCVGASMWMSGFLTAGPEEGRSFLRNAVFLVFLFWWWQWEKSRKKCVTHKNSARAGLLFYSFSNHVLSISNTKKTDCVSDQRTCTTVYVCLCLGLCWDRSWLTFCCYPCVCLSCLLLVSVCWAVLLTQPANKQTLQWIQLLLWFLFLLLQQSPKTTALGLSSSLQDHHFIWQLSLVASHRNSPRLWAVDWE